MRASSRAIEKRIPGACQPPPARSSQIRRAGEKEGLCLIDTSPSGPARASGGRVDLRDHAEARVLARDLVEFRIPTAELVAAALVAGRHLDLAHRQRRAGGADAAEALALRLGRPQQV